ncbi:MAG: PEGA domain-containing protein [Labilithrix sp.]|nr:PEGA domain-containing protein [Labilithrix sp.]MCW5817240.1 PEGA domain-containing protein [Labilithrix sp.]
MRSSFLRTVLFVLFTVITMMPAAAWADAKSDAKTAKSRQTEAAKLKKEADGLMGQDRYADALALYQKAYELSSDPALLYNQGRALEAMGEYPEAIDKLEKFEKDASPSLRAKVPALKELITDLKNRIATLVVTTNAPGARLLVRGKDAGTVAGELKLRTRGGPATVEVAAEGYITFKKDVELAAGSTVKVDAQLQLKKSDAVIFVRSRPPSDISVDGKAIGRVPLEFRLPAGRYTLAADAPGYETETVPMTLSLGDRRELDIELRKSPKITGRWWFWASIAAVVVTGAAIGAYVAFTTEREPEPGTFGGGVRPFQP